MPVIKPTRANADEMQQMRETVPHTAARIANDPILTKCVELMIVMSPHRRAFVDMLVEMDAETLDAAINLIALGLGFVRVSVEEHLLLTRDDGKDDPHA